MKDGDVHQVDAPLGLYNRPVNKFVGGFIGSPPMNFISGTLIESGGNIQFVGPDFSLALTDRVTEEVRARVDKPVFLGIRPEDIHDSQFFPEAGENNVKAMHIEVVEPLGAETLVYLRGAAGEQDIVAKFDSRSDPKVNEDAHVAFDANKVHIFDGETEESLTFPAE
jgi:multiple sugar transport system ATP-binding protein